MKKEYVVNLKGKDYPTYPGILDEAHEKGLTSIETELIQVPTKENGSVAIVKATVKLGDKVFVDYGDASPRNVNSFIATALIRMASTRAKGRALRDAVNVGQTMLEELPEEEPKLKDEQKPKDQIVESQEDYECPECGAIAKKVQGVKSGKTFTGIKCTDNAAHKWNGDTEQYNDAKVFDYKGHQVNV